MRLDWTKSIVLRLTTVEYLTPNIITVKLSNINLSFILFCFPAVNHQLAHLNIETIKGKWARVWLHSASPSETHSPVPSFIRPSLFLPLLFLSSPLCLSAEAIVLVCACVCVCAHVCEKAIHLPPPDTFYNYNGLAFPPCQLMLSSLLCAAVCLCVGTYVWCAWVCVCAYHIAKHHHLSSLVITLYISCHLLWVETRDLGSKHTHTRAHRHAHAHTKSAAIEAVF